jgi:hypothetical protein
MFLKLFSSSKLDQFAENLVQDLVKRYPPAMANNPVQMVSEKRLSTLLDSTFLKAQTFTLENRLGTIRKAMLGNNFKWALKDLGYNDNFVEIATEGLVVHITRKPTG